MKIRLKTFFILFGSTLFFYLPILFKPALVLERDNDLQQQFWPIFYFIREQFWQYRDLPLWNNLFFSGLPLLPDPQFSLFYPLNWLFLIFPINFGFISYFIFHIFLGDIAVYLLMKKHFNLSNIVAFFAASLYLFSPRLAGYLEAGHSGLIASWGLLPWVLLSTLILAKKPTYNWLVLLAISLAGIFFTHTVTFILALTASGTLFTASLIKVKNWKSGLLSYGLGVLAAFGLTAVSLFPQMEWIPQTTRSLLINTKDIYPKWSSVKEFLQDIFIPWAGGLDPLWAIDTEQWLALGLIPSLLALWGFWHLKRNAKLFLFIFSLLVILISLNNASPAYKFLLKMDWYALMRVATRVWFISALAIIVLAGIGLDYLLKVNVRKPIIFFIIFLSLAETIFLSWTRILKPTSGTTNYVPLEVYQFLKNDRDRFRVFCPERCFSQQEAAKANLELIDGYNTLQQTNYYKHMWQLSGGYWNYYTLALPPQGDFRINKLQPDASSLGFYNTKYVISSYPLKNKDLIPKKQFGQFTIYKNNLFKTRAYFKNAPSEKDEASILKFSPNHIRVDTSRQLSNQVILAEVHSPGWKAYLNGKEKTEVLETPISLRLVNIKPDTNFVDFRYQPKSFMIGKIITLITIFLLIGTSLIFRQHIFKR